MSDTQTAPRRDWTNTGRAFYDPEHADHGDGYRLEGGAYPNKPRLSAAFDALKWLEIPKDGTPLDLPFCPGESIKAIIRQCRVPRVSHVAYSHELAPYGLVGVFGHYKNADVKAYGVDTGTEIIMLAADVAEKAAR